MDQSDQTSSSLGDSITSPTSDKLDIIIFKFAATNFLAKKFILEKFFFSNQKPDKTFSLQIAFC